MEQWVGKVAVVTGASSGIGASIATELVKNGLNVVGLARRKERVDELSKELGEKYPGKLSSYKCDVADEKDIKEAFEWIKSNFGGVDVLVNNAGTAKRTMLIAPDNETMLKDTININVLGLCHCTREAVQSMRDRDVAGHVFHINSIVGHKVINPEGYPPVSNIYPASKHAVTALTETLRHELRYTKSNIKITSISPGVVQTEIFDLMFGDTKAAEQFIDKTPHLKPYDVSQAIIYSLGTPPHVQVHEIIIKPMGELY